MCRALVPRVHRHGVGGAAVVGDRLLEARDHRALGEEVRAQDFDDRCDVGFGDVLAAVGEHDNTTLTAILKEGPTNLTLRHNDPITITKNRNAINLWIGIPPLLRSTNNRETALRWTPKWDRSSRIFAQRL